MNVSRCGSVSSGERVELGQRMIGSRQQELPPRCCGQLAVRSLRRRARVASLPPRWNRGKQSEHDHDRSWVDTAGYDFAFGVFTSTRAHC